MTYIVTVPPNSSVVCAVTVPAELVSVRFQMAIDPFVAYSWWYIVVDEVLFPASFTVTITVPTMLSVMTCRHAYVYPFAYGPIVDEK
jgi:hypothetical protein